MSTNKLTYFSDSLTKTEGLHKLVPLRKNSVFIVYPYKNMGKRVDQIASDLSLFGLPLFTVNDDAFYAGEAEMDPIRRFFLSYDV